MTKTLSPLHPGEVLREEFMKPLGLTPYKLAAALGHIPRTRIERIQREEIGISTDTALRLARFFGTTPEFWINLQTSYEIETRRAKLAKKLEAIHPRELEPA